MGMLRSIPAKIEAKLNKITTPAIVIGCIQNLTEKRIRETKLNLLGFKIDGEKLSIDNNIVIPDQNFGSTSKENINGKEVIHKDKEKITKNIYLGERPIFGDWSKGSFPLWQTRDVYQKSFIQPKGLSIKIEIHDYDKLKKQWKVSFFINYSFLKDSSEFEKDLLFSLSLLNEVTKKYDIYSSETTSEQIISSRFISWEIFPTGEKDIKSVIEQRLSPLDSEKNKIILERALVIEKLNPKQFIFGTEISNDYYGALFHENLIIFENIRYGNATYILYENWEEISKLSRTEILNSDNNFDRIIHTSNWEKTLSEILKYRLKNLI